MKITIDIPKEFEKHFSEDRFKDSLERIKADLNDEFVFAGLYERELLEMLTNAFKTAEFGEPTLDDYAPIKHGHWIRGKNKSAFPTKPSVIWYCSCCGEMIRYNDSTGTYQKKKKKVNEVNPRCRRCGARMDGDSE